MAPPGGSPAEPNPSVRPGCADVGCARGRRPSQPGSGPQVTPQALGRSEPERRPARPPHGPALHLAEGPPSPHWLPAQDQRGVGEGPPGLGGPAGQGLRAGNWRTLKQSSARRPWELGEGQTASAPRKAWGHPELSRRWRTGVRCKSRVDLPRRARTRLRLRHGPSQGHRAEKQPGTQSLAGDPWPASAHPPPPRSHPCNQLSKAPEQPRPELACGQEEPARPPARAPGLPRGLPALQTWDASDPSRLRVYPGPPFLMLPWGEAALAPSKEVKKCGFSTRNTPGGCPRCRQGQLEPGACGLGQA